MTRVRFLNLDYYRHDYHLGRTDKILGVRKFATFKYYDDVNLDTSLFLEESFGEYKRNIDVLKNGGKVAREHVTRVLKLPLLYRDMIEKERWDTPITFLPQNPLRPLNGFGKLLLSHFFLPDMLYDLVYYKEEHDGIKPVKALIRILEERFNPGPYECVDVYYKYIKDDIAFSQMVDFMVNQDEKVESHQGAWVTEVFENYKSTLFVEIMELINKSTFQSDEDYIALLKDLVQFDCKLDSKKLA